MLDREAINEPTTASSHAPSPGETGDHALIDRLDDAARAVTMSLAADSPLAARILSLRDRLRQQRLQVAVLGQFKRGKSTFINALLGAALLPTGVLPLTAVPTFISWRESSLIRIHFANRKETEQVPAGDANAARDVLFQFVTEEGNPRNRLGVERVELFYPAPLLRGGICLIDTPGIGSTLGHNTQAALRVLPECDASLFILSADPPITEAELDYLRRLKSKMGRTFFVLNKIDYLAADERAAVADFLRNVLVTDSFLEPGAEILAVSSRLGLSAKQQGDDTAWQQSGMAEVERQFQTYLLNEKEPLLRDAIRRKTCDILDGAAGEIELRITALKMPLDELQRSSLEFANELAKIRAQRVNLADLLSADRRRLIENLEKRTQALRRSALSRLTGAVDDALSHPDGTWERKLKMAVSTTIEDVFGNARERFIDGFSRQVDDILAGHWRTLEALTEEIRRTASRMFEVKLPAQAGPESFRLAQEPYWIDERIASSLIPDFSRLFDRLFPSTLRRSRRRARVLAETNELVVRNAESLRWAILRGIDETFRSALSQLDERFGETIAATEGVIHDALERRRDRAATARSVLERLDQSRRDVAAARQALVGSE
ncbi:MAG TPA: dynamin family protein [Xanthobacteraceae bacterium]|nr:dynamin family protein [Xanthobacteraceae bacterium]